MCFSRPLLLWLPLAFEPLYPPALPDPLLPPSPAGGGAGGPL